jgi:hypothetical protein
VQVTPEETLAVLTQGEGYADYAQGFLAAAQLIGATAYQVNVPASIAHGGYAANIGKTPIAGNRPVIEAVVPFVALDAYFRESLIWAKGLPRSQEC